MYTRYTGCIYIIPRKDYHMKLPNGYGSVYRLPGNRRKPWCVRVTVSTKPYKYRYLGYYPSQEDALTALALYHKDPYDLDTATITFSEIYDRWSAEHFPKVSRTSVRSYGSAYAVLEPLLNMRFTDIKLSHLQGVVDNCGKNYPTLLNIKLLMSQMYQYAMRHELCQKDYSQFVDITQYKDRNPNRIDRVPFTDAEITDLWERSADPYVQVVLMLLYSGVRVMELLGLRKEDVDLQKQCFHVRSSKTAAGIRTVPIHDRTLPFFVSWMDRSPCGYLICTTTGSRMIYNNYNHRTWDCPGHRPHDTRHTFISRMVAAGVDERIIKRIVGHRGRGVTDNVYTHIDLQTLLDAVNQLK